MKGSEIAGKTSPQDEEIRPKKKAKVDTKAPVAKTPYDLWKEALHKKLDTLDAGLIVVRDLKNPNVTTDDEDEEEDEEEVDEACYKTLTQEQIDLSFRGFLVTKSRKDAMEIMGKLVLQEDYGEIMHCFTTRFSYQVVDAYDDAQRLIQKEKDPAQKLNLLFAFTFQLDAYDWWMNDHEVGYIEEYGGGKMVKSIAGYFKRILKKHSAKDLGLDDGYSYEGMMAFLEQFKEKLKSVDSLGPGPSFKFNYK